MRDLWADWLLTRRHGGDPRHEPIVRAEVVEILDRVLAGARLKQGMVLVDVGSGDGLVGFGAIERIGPELSVIFTDISKPLLLHAEMLATELGVAGQCTFLHTPAETLAGVADGSADVVTSRAVLAYVRDKPAALRRFFEVLKPGGRVSIAEPISQDDAVQLTALTRMLQSRPVSAVTEWSLLLQRCRAQQFPSTLAEIKENPMTNFTERDLVRLFQETGFTSLHMELHIDIRRGQPTPWNTFIDIAPRPGTPTLREIFAAQFSEEERNQFEAGLRPAVESGELTSRDTVAYLTAEKPVEAA